MMGLCAALAFSLAACGANKNEDVSLSSESSETSSAESVKDQNPEKEETKIVEVTEEATSEKSEDGTLVVTTESGEKIVISEDTEKTENADGSVTYKTGDGKEVKVEADGTAEVHSTQEIKVPASSGSSTQQNTQGGQSASSGANQSSSTAKCKHTNTSWKTVTEATCNVAGKKVKYCTTCGTEVKSESIAKTGNHVSGDWKVTVQPTENSTGTKVKNCTVCGKQLESASIDKVAHSHNYVWVESGNTRTKKCSCGASKGVTETNYGGHWGYFDSGMASSLFNEANSARQEAQYVERDVLGNIIYAGNVQAVSRDSSLDSLAERRATEVLSNWSHQGRDIDSYYTTENLAKGFNSVIDVLCAWSASHDHAGTLTYQYYTKAGAAWFWWDADNTGENLVGVAVMEYSE